jgi:hypothetical protein
MFYIHVRNASLIRVEIVYVQSIIRTEATSLLLRRELRNSLLLALANPASACLFFRAKLEPAHPSSQPLVNSARLNPHALLVRFAFAVSRLPPVALLVLSNSRNLRNLSIKVIARSARIVRRRNGAVRSVRRENRGSDLAAYVVGEHAAVQEAVDADRRVAETEQMGGN